MTKRFFWTKLQAFFHLEGHLDTETDRAKRERYFALLERLNEPVGDWRKGELEIVTQPMRIRQHLKAGGEPMGIMYEDRYVYFLRDLVLFPPKPGSVEPRLGTYIRVVYKNRLKGNPGIFILAYDTYGRLVLNRTYRHATRHWMLEGQGTIAKDSERREESVERCVRDEIGRPISQMSLLCEDFVSERGLVGDAIPVYLVALGGQPIDHVEDATIAGHVALVPEAYESALQKGYYEIDGIAHRLRDGYTMSAFLLAKLRKLL